MARSWCTWNVASPWRCSRSGPPNQWRSGCGEHPGVEVIARDRASAYAEGARHGAPGATQVADRFHLLQNLAEALTHVFTTHGRALDAVNATAPSSPCCCPMGPVRSRYPHRPRPQPRRRGRPSAPPAGRRAMIRCGRCIARAGAPGHRGAGRLQLSYHRAVLADPAWPVRQHRRHYGRSLVNPYKAYLLERWNAGCHTAIQLFQDLRARGYTGSYRRVTAYVSRIRQAQGIPPRRQARRQRLPVVAEPGRPTLDAASGDVAGPETHRASHGGRGPATRPAPRAVGRGRRGNRSRAGLCDPGTPAPARAARCLAPAGRRPVRWRPCDALPPGSGTTMRPSKPGVTLALVHWPGRGAYQSPQNAEKADVWPRAPRSP